MYEDKDKIQHSFMLRILSKLELEIFVKELTGLQKRKENKTKPRNNTQQLSHA